MFFNEPQSFCSFFKCSIEQPKAKSIKSQSASLQPKLKKSLSHKKKWYTKGRETSQKKTKTRSYDSKEADQKNIDMCAVKNHHEQVFQMYYSGSKKNRAIQKTNNKVNYRPSYQNDDYYALAVKKDQEKINSKQTYLYSPSDISITGYSTEVNTTIKTGMENLQPTLKILPHQYSQPIFKTKISKAKLKQSKEILGIAIQNNANKEKQISFSNENCKLNPEAHNSKVVQIQYIPNLSKATQDQYNGNYLQPPKRRKNQQSWQFFSNTTSSNAISVNNGSSIFLRQKTVQSVLDENSVLQQQESFVERIHGPAEGQILSLFQFKMANQTK